MTIHRHDVHWLAIYAVAILSFATSTRLAGAAPSCTASCVARMHACRAERCPTATGKDRRRCRDVCRAVTGCAAGAARTRTIATVVNECRSTGTPRQWTGRQRLEIRRGDCQPVTVVTIEADVAAPDPLRICEVYGRIRDGFAAQSVGVLEGVAVSPDGETVLFQLTDDFVGRLEVQGVKIASPAFLLPDEGIFTVRSDGSDLRRIADQSSEAPFAVIPTTEFPFIAVPSKPTTGFSYSPDGKTVVYIDHGPGADGSVAPQIFTLDPRNGARRQLTAFTASSIGTDPPDGIAMDALFLDDEQIGGYVFDSVEGNRILRIRRDGTDFHYVDVDPVSLPGAMLVQTFRLAGLFNDVWALALDVQTEQPFAGAVREIFVRNGRNLLQLTNLGRSDTGFPIRSRGHEHVIFSASGDPLPGANPSLTCQLFSVDVLGRHLRQLTHFDPGVASSGGCALATAEGCMVGAEVVVQDAATGAIVFDSSCDPFGVRPVSQQLYAVRPDGSGFRQVTGYRGMTVDPDGTVSVELPGPIVYQALFK